MMTRKTLPANSVGWTTKVLEHSLQPLEKRAAPAKRRVISLACVEAKRNQRIYNVNSNHQPSMFSKGIRRHTRLWILHFSPEQTSQTHSAVLLFRFVLMGWKERWKQTPAPQQTLWMHEHKFERLQSPLEKRITLQPTDTQLYAFVQNEPVPLGCHCL